MKRLVTLVLALLMTLAMASTAMAAYAYDIMLDNDEDLGDNEQMLPGVVYEYKLQEGSKSPRISLDYFALHVDYNEGKSYVDYVRKQDDRVVVKLRSDVSYTSEKEIDIDITLTARKDITKKIDGETETLVEKGDEYSYNINEIVAENMTEVEPEEDADNVNVYVGDNADTIYYTDGEKGYVAFSAGDRDFELLVKMGRNSKIYIDVDTDSVSSIYKAYKGVSGANLSYYTFNKSPSLGGTGVMSIRKQAYVYKWSGSKLSRISTSMEDGRCTWDVTGKLGTYVISDKALTAGAEVVDDDTDTDTTTSTDTSNSGVSKNPDTGR